MAVKCRGNTDPAYPSTCTVTALTFVVSCRIWPSEGQTSTGSVRELTELAGQRAALGLGSERSRPPYHRVGCADRHKRPALGAPPEPEAHPDRCHANDAQPHSIRSRVLAKAPVDRVQARSGGN